jgi:hypothetical protein
MSHRVTLGGAGLVRKQNAQEGKMWLNIFSMIFKKRNGQAGLVLLGLNDFFGLGGVGLSLSFWYRALG